MAQQQWSVDQDVREDADSVFVPVEELPHAAIGDLVRFRSAHAGTPSGRVTALVADGERGSFFTVGLDPSSA